jgi:hypothetical protein
MLAGALTAGLMAMPLAGLPASERSPFHFPGEHDFRFQHIARGEREKDWPFTVDEGWLMCAWVMGTRAVYFAEMQEEDTGDLPRMIIVSTDPIEAMVAYLAGGKLIVPAAGLEEVIPLLAPLERLGEKLCDQPRGVTIGPAEL